MNDDTTYFSPGDEKPQDKNVKKKQAKKNKGAIAGLTGAILGGSAAVVIGKLGAFDAAAQSPVAPVEPIEESHSSHSNHHHTTNAPSHKTASWHAETLGDAGEITDEMSYEEAFSIAREQVGPGGVFEWRGTLFSTYTADEWNALTDEERIEYNNLFDWDRIDNISDDMAFDDALDSQDIDVLTDDIFADNGDMALNDSGEIEVLDVDSEIEVLGVYNDSDSGIGNFVVDDSDVVMIDVNDDMDLDMGTSNFSANDGDQSEMEIAENHVDIADDIDFSDNNDLAQASDDYYSSMDDFSIDV